MLLGIDTGTTHLKAGLFDRAGEAVAIAVCPNRVEPGWKGIRTYNPEVVWEQVCELIRIATRHHSGQVRVVGVAGMAETGLLVDRLTGEARTPLIPWFETCAAGQVERVQAEIGGAGFFLRTGLHPAAKYSLMKLLWLKQIDPALLRGAVWLSTPDWIVYRLCGVMQTDYTLAERTGAFRPAEKDWDAEMLAHIGIDADIFPAVRRSGEPAGETDDLERLGFRSSVAVAGHDHVCGAWAVMQLASANEAPPVFDSIGTAEALIGMLPKRALGQRELKAGFSFGVACDPDFIYWQGGLSASGGSLEWIGAILSSPPLSYAEMEGLAAGAEGPTGILYFPYLVGSGSPHSDSAARGGFLGLNAGHTRADLVRAVLEGCAFEMEYQRRRAVEALAAPVGRVVAAGGGTRNRVWMQIKADVFGSPLEILEQDETTLLGAALLAGFKSGVYRDRDDLSQAIRNLPRRTLEPDPVRSRAYQTVFEVGYVANEAKVRAARSRV